jgi:hypothetical protein
MRHPGHLADTRPVPRPAGVLVIECTDPLCGMHPGEVSIHHLDATGDEPAAQREEAGASHAGPFADPSDLHSEGGSSEQRTTGT